MNHCPRQYYHSLHHHNRDEGVAMLALKPRVYAASLRSDQLSHLCGQSYDCPSPRGKFRCRSRTRLRTIPNPQIRREDAITYSRPTIFGTIAKEVIKPTAWTIPQNIDGSPLPEVTHRRTRSNIYSEQNQDSTSTTLTYREDIHIPTKSITSLTMSIAAMAPSALGVFGKLPRELCEKICEALDDGTGLVHMRIYIGSPSLIVTACSTSYTTQDDNPA